MNNEEKTMEERFDDKFLKVGSRHIVVESYGEAFKETIQELKSFIQLEIDLARAEERKEVVEKIESRKKEWYKQCLTDDFVNGRFWEAVEIINLIKNQ